jgi:phosphoribosylformylglycinamidine cyclo-ligase
MMQSEPALTYRESGVDIVKADHFIDWVRRKSASTCRSRVVSGVGGFAALYDMGDGRYLASGTDGVGTKLILARQLGIHGSIGIDLVAMCVNDVICTGAKPLFFLDYFACGRLDLGLSQQVISGIVDGCDQAKIALIGGETAEMPGMYESGEYDLAGFCVGEVRKQDLLGGDKVLPGDALIAIASSGFHSNGFSLLRKLLREDDFGESGLAASLLTPTRIYAGLVESLLKVLGDSLHGISHITGSGLENIPRMNEKLLYRIDRLPDRDDLPAHMAIMMERSGLPEIELRSTFNMGAGLVISTDAPEKAMAALDAAGEKYWLIGSVTGSVIESSNDAGVESSGRLIYEI